MAEVVLGLLPGLRVNIDGFGRGRAKVTFENLLSFIGGRCCILRWEKSMKTFASGPKINIFVAKLLL